VRRRHCCRQQCPMSATATADIAAIVGGSNGDRNWQHCHSCRRNTDRSADVCAQTCAWLQILWVCTCAQTYACHAHAHTRARAHTRTHTHIRTNSARRVLNLSKSVHDRMPLQTESPPLKVGRFKSQHGVKSASLENPLLKCDASNPAIEACSKQVDARANEGLV